MTVAVCTTSVYVDAARLARALRIEGEDAEQIAAIADWRAGGDAAAARRIVRRELARLRRQRRPAVPVDNVEIPDPAADPAEIIEAEQVAAAREGWLRMATRLPGRLGTIARGIMSGWTDDRIGRDVGIAARRVRQIREDRARWQAAMRQFTRQADLDLDDGGES